MSPHTRDRVLAVANRTRYVQKTGRRITTLIGFVYTQEMTLSHPFDAAVFDGVVSALGEHQLDAVVLSLQRDKRRDETCTHFFFRKGVRGVVLRTMAATRQVCGEIAAEGFPHIVISERFAAPNVNCIDSDSQADTRRAVEYLISLGHRRIAFGMHSVPDRDHLDRREGYCQALASNGLPLDEQLILAHPFTLAGGASIMTRLLAMPDPPTAVFLADPLLAVGAVKRAQELGARIPGDISIIGFDDTDVRFGVHPTLTAVCQDATALGYEAGRWLAQALVTDSPAVMQRTIPTFFEINHSAGPPPAKPRRIARPLPRSGVQLHRK